VQPPGFLKFEDFMLKTKKNIKKLIFSRGAMFPLPPKIPYGILRQSAPKVGLCTLIFINYTAYLSKEVVVIECIGKSA